jgi:general secretion pathway protein I
MSNSPLSEDGFSLLELLVAMAVLSLAVIPMLATQSTAIKSTVLLNEKTLAKIVAENALVELTTSEIGPVPGIVRGNDRQANIDFNWQANIKQMPTQPVTSISLTVNRDGKKKSLYQVIGFRKAT